MKIRFFVLLLYFSNILFAMDLQLVSPQGINPHKKLNSRYEIKLSDKSLYDMFHCRATVTIAKDKHTIALVQKSAERGILEENKFWNNISITQKQLDEIASKSKIFYLYAYAKDGYKNKYGPCYSIKVIQKIMHMDDRSISIQLEDFHEKIVQKTYWNVSSVMTLIQYGFVPFTAVYQFGLLERCRRFVTSFWS